MLKEWKDRILAGAVALVSFFGGMWIDTVNGTVQQVHNHEASIAVLVEMHKRTLDNDARITDILHELQKILEKRQR